MNCRRKFAAFLMVVTSMAVISFAPQPAQAHGTVVHGGYGVYGVYAAPVYSAPVYAAPVYTTPVPVYAGYAAPVPVSYGPYLAPYPAVAPIGHRLIYPRHGTTIKYKYRKGLWYVDIRD